ncbi:DNA-3-methyladenine glycosylase [Chlorobium sp. BLA1]|uniref:DNA-3-methyladenine glycosylase n=1 Tax=Candidatus Chlorobium masyuteum TaxID=2716876 RepID=UPI00141FAD7D|nr:DNA-3-methyladenine glycosylase [Candidatus Chlorobium masyuteum]NHQ59987.1 DNA-3-methyladenine glycosylase [Candidatus Chlorobium masyuteum]NTU44834.1 DNA-3-methyladenine glycosylase [Chlorobiaceae bacterium]
MERLEKQFYEIPTLELAEKLLGKIFVRTLPGNLQLKARIVETEAYLGVDDEACHAWRGRTERNSTMFHRPGTIYVYFTYGCHHLINIVSEPENRAGAVLLRAMEPVEGISFMQMQRGKAVERELMSGPGKLARALQIERRDNGRDLFGEEFYLENAPPVPERMIGTTTRVGISRSRDLPWRKFIVNNPHVSKARIS